MAQGKVKWFSPEKGYGFIIYKDKEDIFVHYTDIAGNGFRMLVEGEWVEFELTKSERGWRARNVRRLGFINPEKEKRENTGKGESYSSRS